MTKTKRALLPLAKSFGTKKTVDKDWKEKEWRKLMKVSRQYLKRKVKKTGKDGEKLVRVYANWYKIAKKSYYMMRNRIGTDDYRFACYINYGGNRVLCERKIASKGNRWMRKKLRKSRGYRTCLIDGKALYKTCKKKGYLAKRRKELAM